MCLERLWAYAAQRKREKYPLQEACIAYIREVISDGLEATGQVNETALNTAIHHGLVRLERIKDSTEVQWVDAV